MKIELSEDEICAVRMAVREFRIAAPKHIEDNQQRYERWLEERELFSQDMREIDKKMTDVLESIFNQKNKG